MVQGPKFIHPKLSPGYLLAPNQRCIQVTTLENTATLLEKTSTNYVSLLCSKACGYKIMQINNLITYAF